MMFGFFSKSKNKEDPFEKSLIQIATEMKVALSKTPFEIRGQILEPLYKFKSANELSASMANPDLSEIFLIWFLLGGPRILYLCAFFWGLAGASMAILTPDISHYDLDYIFFMIGHGMIIVGVLYATVALDNRPYTKDILNVSVITAFILLPNIYLINDLLGEPANFWYLQAKPDGASLMDMFPDPPHSLFYTTPLAIAVFCLIYLPYFIKDRISK